MATDVPGRPPLRVGDRFRVVDRLGDGGTAIVYLAWDEVERGWCALKVIQQKYLNDREMRNRFDQEAEALRMLQHPNVPRLILHDPEADPPFIAMELARRGSAMDWVRANGPMPATMVADVIFQVCEALAEAHAAGVYHRDVKPHNFLLDEDGLCKLTDFGIARLPDNTSLTATGSQIGTFSFMAPEQRSDTKTVDHRADIYSVGASLYTLLSARTSAELFVADQDDELLSVIHEAFRPVVVGATRYRPEDRYASVLELQTAMMNGLSRIPPAGDDFPPLAQPVAPLPSTRPETVPADRHFRDLRKALEKVEARRAEEASAAAAAAAAAVASASVPAPLPTERSSQVMPYRMPRRTPRPVRQRGELPDYLDESERGALRRRAAAGQRQRIEAAAEAESARSLTAEAARANADLRDTKRMVGVVAAAVAGLLLVVLGSVMLGTWSVSRARVATDGAAEVLIQTLQDNVGVAYRLPVDRAEFEGLYHSFRSARGDQRALSAAEFVGALDRAIAAGASIRAIDRPKVSLLRSARDNYIDAHVQWEDAAGGIPGLFAVWSGFVDRP